MIRKAKLDERAAIEQLIAESARSLSLEDYSEQQIEAALAKVYGVDSDLIVDGTYFVADSSGMLIGCGGWSKRRNLFGSDQYASRDSSELDPELEPAKIRAFFVHPLHARKGIARAILSVCESEARACGFRSLELMATLPGLRLYRACGYQGGERVLYEMENGLSIEFVPMRKVLQ
ncbi:MAG TPA: GNAT family N-acetyltransferase [Pyrinomonadaceae bacterium]